MNKNISFSGEGVIDGKGSTANPGLEALCQRDSMENGMETLKDRALKLLGRPRLTILGKDPVIHILR